MQEHFYESQQLLKEQLQPLMQRRNGPGLLRFVLQYGLLLGSGAIVVWRYDQAWWQWVPALFVFALMTMGMFALVHEVSHNTAFRSRWLNELVLWLATFPIFYVPTGFRQFHFAHHRHTHHPTKDPERSVGGRPTPLATSGLGMYLSFNTGLPILMYKLGLLCAAAFGHTRVVWDGFLSYVAARQRRRLRWEARLFLALHITIGIIAWYWLPGLFLLWVGQILGHAMLSFYLVGEHNGLSHEGDILNRTRTMVTFSPLKYLMWNMTYHAEHHAYPAVPWHALPQLHTLLQKELKYTESSYTTFHGRVLGQLARGQSFQDLHRGDETSTS